MSKLYLCFNFILCICYVFMKFDCVYINIDKLNFVCKLLNMNVILMLVMYIEVVYSSLC